MLLISKIFCSLCYYVLGSLVRYVTTFWDLSFHRLLCSWIFSSLCYDLL